MKPWVPFDLAQTDLAKGTSLLEASAGTGKTYTISGLFLRLILEHGLSVREILVVTYTEAATEELRGRIRSLLAEAAKAFAKSSSQNGFLDALLKRHARDRPALAERLERALSGFDEAPVYTIHGFCQRTLKDRAFESGSLFDTELVTDPSDLYREVAEDFWRQQFYAAGPIRVGFALKNKYSPETFCRLLSSCVRHPELKFFSRAAGRSLTAVAQALEEAFAKAKAEWEKHAASIRSYFGRPAAWANKPYNDEQAMETRFAQVEACFSGGQLAWEDLPTLAEFTSQAIAEGTRKRAKQPAPDLPFFKLCDALAEAELDFLDALDAAFIAYATAELPRRKAARKIQAFEDLLTCLHAALRGPGGTQLAADLRRRYPAALIDEFQDTDPIQYDIFHAIFAGDDSYLFLIGDPKQAIYGFRGADLFTYLATVEHAQRHFTLGQNWRSESALVQAVNAVFGRPRRPFVFRGIEFRPADARGRADATPLTVDGRAEAPLQIHFWEREGESVIAKGLAEQRLPNFVAAEIVRLLSSRAQLGNRLLQPGDVAVLVLTNRQARLIQEALIGLNVPSVLHTTASVFGSHEADELKCVLGGMAQPSHERSLRAALATDLLGVKSAECEALQADESRWQSWLERFHAYLELWTGHGFIHMFRQFLAGEGVRTRLLGFPDGERRLTNLLHLGELLHQTSLERRLGPGALVKWFTEQNDADFQAADEHQLRLERDENAVRLVTVHKSKGLEYPVVFCPFVSRDSDSSRRGSGEVFFHDPKDQNRLARDHRTEAHAAHQQLAAWEALAENVRLFYVALTRAKHRCCLVWGAFKNAGTSAPAWLFHRVPAVADPPGPMDQLNDHFQTLSDGEMKRQLGELAAAARGPDGRATVTVCTLSFAPAPGPLGPAGSEPGSALAPRQFTSRIRRDWLISSFSALVAGRASESPDRDGVIESAPVEATAAAGIFAFPRGTKPGTCLHRIFEQLDFLDADDARLEEVAHAQLVAHGFDPAEHGAGVKEMLRNVLSLPLLTGRADFTLRRVARTERLNELEFYFPVRNLEAKALGEFFQRHGLAAGPLPSQIGRLKLNLLSGFMMGFIDLVFRFEHRYYIVDWKSNWLGNRAEDYHPTALQTEMGRHQYHLQYHLYAAALHKYLERRLPDYRYADHFGGVYYLFLRGMDTRQPHLGVYQDRPAEAVIHELHHLLLGQKPSP